LGAGTLLSGAAAAAESPLLEEREIEVPGERLARRCLMLLPREPSGRERVLVLFHGLGETVSQALGIRAWADRYGLVSAHARLSNPPVARTLSDAKFLTDERITTLNQALGAVPFRGLALVCPFTPNVYREPSTPAALDRYAAWIADGVLPRVAAELGRSRDGLSPAVDGVSLGGYVSLEVFLRRPESFAAVGTTQGAFRAPLADAYAARLDKAFSSVGKKPVRVATSGFDSGRAASERLARRLGERGVEVTLSVPPGPHDQRWLREVGSLELLYHYDRTLGRKTPAPRERG
jgi:pimeloyl-ACP methyl ester carboxylesterase